jgi:hypothetical protein
VRTHHAHAHVLHTHAILCNGASTLDRPPGALAARVRESRQPVLVAIGVDAVANAVLAVGNARLFLEQNNLVRRGMDDWGFCAVFVRGGGLRVTLFSAAPGFGGRASCVVGCAILCAFHPRQAGNTGPLLTCGDLTWPGLHRLLLLPAPDSCPYSRMGWHGMHASCGRRTSERCQSLLWCIRRSAS